MSDRGAIESIAETLADLDGWNNPPDDPLVIEQAQRILDRLAADGWTVVRTEWETDTSFAKAEGVPVMRRRVYYGPWEPVPEGSEGGETR